AALVPYPLSLHDALPIFRLGIRDDDRQRPAVVDARLLRVVATQALANDALDSRVGRVGHDHARLATALGAHGASLARRTVCYTRSEEHTSELQSLAYLVC